MNWLFFIPAIALGMHGYGCYASEGLYFGGRSTRKIRHRPHSDGGICNPCWGVRYPLKIPEPSAHTGHMGPVQLDREKTPRFWLFRAVPIP